MQKDISGKQSYSKLKAVKFNTDSHIQFFQYGKGIRLNSLSLENKILVNGTLSNFSGQKLYEWDIIQGQTDYSFEQIDLTPGIYVVSLFSPIGVHTQKINIQ